MRMQEKTRQIRHNLISIALEPPPLLCLDSSLEPKQPVRFFVGESGSYSREPSRDVQSVSGVSSLVALFLEVSLYILDMAAYKAANISLPLGSMFEGLMAKLCPYRSSGVKEYLIPAPSPRKVPLFFAQS